MHRAVAEFLPTSPHTPWEICVDGPTIGSARAPMIQAAGKDHVIFSKKLLMIIAAVIATSVFIFFVIEQSRANGNWAISREAMKQNADIKSSNMQLSDAREELQKEEDEYVAGLLEVHCRKRLHIVRLPSLQRSHTRCSRRLVNLYSTWLDEDGQEIELSQEQLKQLKDQLAAIQDKVGSHSSSLKEKDAQLEEKERRLKVQCLRVTAPARRHARTRALNTVLTLWRLHMS